MNPTRPQPEPSPRAAFGVAQIMFEGSPVVVARGAYDDETFYLHIRIEPPPQELLAALSVGGQLLLIQKTIFDQLRPLLQAIYDAQAHAEARVDERQKILGQLRTMAREWSEKDKDTKATTLFDAILAIAGNADAGGGV